VNEKRGDHIQEAPTLLDLYQLVTKTVHQIKEKQLEIECLHLKVSELMSCRILLYGEIRVVSKTQSHGIKRQTIISQNKIKMELARQSKELGNFCNKPIKGYCYKYRCMHCAVSMHRELDPPVLFHVNPAPENEGSDSDSDFVIDGDTSIA
jgi:hypothetical protein